MQFGYLNNSRNNFHETINFDYCRLPHQRGVGSGGVGVNRAFRQSADGVGATELESTLGVLSRFKLLYLNMVHQFSPCDHQMPLLTWPLTKPTSNPKPSLKNFNFQSLTTAHFLTSAATPLTATGRLESHRFTFPKQKYPHEEIFCACLELFRVAFPEGRSPHELLNRASKNHVTLHHSAWLSYKQGKKRKHDIIAGEFIFQM